MPTIRYLNTTGINTYINPLAQNDGVLLHAKNVISTPYGAKTKRYGYETYLGTPDTSEVTGLFSFTKDNADSYLYRTSNNKIYYSINGTSAWAVAVNGTISGDVGYAILNNTIIVGDGVGSTRHSTSGTSFTNTTLAPVAKHFEQYQRRIYASGTSSTLFYSTSNDATNWQLAGTSDSSSFTIPGEGTIQSLFAVADRLVASKSNGNMFKWDGYSLVDVTTKKGPTSYKSIKSNEGYYVYLNRDGITGFGGGRPELLSNPIESQIRNNLGSGIAGTTFANAPAGITNWEYYLSVGTVTDSLTKQKLNDNIIKYDFLKNEYTNYKFAHFPTSYTTYIDTNKKENLLFGDKNGQVYKMSETATSDAGQPIEAELIFMLHGGVPDISKKWNEINLFFNPGCEARVQVAPSYIFDLTRVRWQDLGDVTEGVIHYRFQQGTRSKFLFVKITDNSTVAPFTYYGMAVDVEQAGVADG